MKRYILVLFAFALLLNCSKSFKTDYPIQPVPFTDVHFNDTFWKPRLETNRTVTIPFDFKKCEETGRINNFAIAGGLMEGKHEGMRYNDSDVFKIIEGASYSLSMHPDPELDKYLDDVIHKIAVAQEDDGYLFTTRTIDSTRVAARSGDTRWSYISMSHELYNVGHMYEAAVAHYQATGKRTFLNVAIKSADLIESLFGPGKNMDPPGHQEIEIGLVKLYRVTGNQKYLDLAKFFLDQRGNAEGHDLYGEYSQDHQPVVEQSCPTGHAVRAGYLYSGMADVAAIVGDQEYVTALDNIWQNTVYTRLYLTGGIGARHTGEAFGEEYELPNMSAYNETCAAIANMFWNQRMFLLHGDAKYIDVMERTLYNGFLSGVSLDGNEFFYPNPLESDGSHSRSPWFDCACCPTNVVRFLPSLPGYQYAINKDTIYVNLFIGGSADLNLNGQSIKIHQKTNYPWDGIVEILPQPESSSKFTLSVRIPGWAMETPVPGDLYHFMEKSANKPVLKINGNPVEYTLRKGFADLSRQWQKGDIITLELPMPVRKVLSNDKVDEDRGKLALQRGPLVYCAEWVDNHGHARDLLVPKNAIFSVNPQPELLHGINTITGSVKLENGRRHELTAIPYYSWAHRGAGDMAVWMKYVD